MWHYHGYSKVKECVFWLVVVVVVWVSLCVCLGMEIAKR